MTATEDPGLWLSESLLSSLEDVGPVPIAVYVVVALSTADQYWPAWKIARYLGVKRDKVWAALELLHERELINDYDFRGLQDAETREPEPGT